MKNTIIKKFFIKNVFPHLSSHEWIVRRNLIFKSNPNEVLKGICLESSAYAVSQFAVNIFVQPLFIPADGLYFNFGYRQKTPEKREWWNLDESNTEQVGLQLARYIDTADEEFFNNRKDALDFYNVYRSSKKATIRNFEAVAYCACFSGSDQASDEVKGLLKYIERNEDLNQAWVMDIYQKTNELQQVISNPIPLMGSWKNGTLSQLSLL